MPAVLPELCASEALPLPVAVVAGPLLLPAVADGLVNALVDVLVDVPAAPAVGVGCKCSPGPGCSPLAIGVVPSLFWSAIAFTPG
ncbi:hypothetical protein ASE07_23465 [Noviherbaspirillum sp. Root189]|nr:hypothetical protein ASE07_23465 [Noviherbaspirillum sp. Root189]